MYFVWIALIGLITVCTASAEALDRWTNLRPITLRETTHTSIPATRSTTIEQYAKQVHANKHPLQTFLEIKHDTHTPPTYWHAQRGITITDTDTAADDVIYLISRGFAAQKSPSGTDPYSLFARGCAGIVDAYVKIRDTIVRGTCITFDYTTDARSKINIGQDEDVECLKTIYNQIHTQAPHVRIVIVGDCKGALTALRFASSHPPQLAGLIMLAPLTTLKNLTDALSKKYIFNTGKRLLHWAFKKVCGGYDDTKDTLFEELDTVPDIPIIIGHRKGDSLVLDTHHAELVTALKQSNHNHVHSVVINDKNYSHSWITPSREFQKELHHLLGQYKLLP